MENIGNDKRITGVEALLAPGKIEEMYPVSPSVMKMIDGFRETIGNILGGRDSRLLAIVGPCSIHDPKAAIEYATKLKGLSEKLSDVFFIVMRTYFEKPRTTTGWKGLILDPDMDGSYNIPKGVQVARKLLLDIASLGLPLGCEVLDPIIPQYTDVLMSRSSIGARTTESQVHRNLASGLSVPVGFKNSTSGDITNALNAIKSANCPASFIGVNKDGQCSVFHTSGNEYAHLIMRGGDDGPNYYEDVVEEAGDEMKKRGLLPSIIIDCSHANSKKDYNRQKRVLRNVIEQVTLSSPYIKGFMLESNLFEGSQKISESSSSLRYGVSVTDGCIGWDETERIMEHAADVLRKSKLEKEDKDE